MAGDSGVTATCNETSERGARSAVAVTVATPPFSATEAGETSILLTGVTSLSGKAGVAKISRAISLSSLCRHSNPWPVRSKLPFVIDQPSSPVSTLPAVPRPTMV